MQDVIFGAFADEAGASVEEQIAAMTANGIRHLEARNVEGKNFVDLTAAEARDLRSRLDAHGLRVWSIGSPLGKIGIRDDFAAHLDKLKHTLELAGVMGSEKIRMFSFYIPAGEDPAVYRDEVMERLARMLETARGSGVMLCHENEKGIYGETAARCRDILDQFPEMGGIFDPANFIQSGEETLPAWELLGDRITYMHIKDCLPDGETVVPCGRGAGHLPEILHRFLAAGGNQLTLEPHLTVFDGLAALENEGSRSRIDSTVYRTQREAFDAAVAALKETMSYDG